MFKKIFVKQSSSIAVAAAVVGVSSLLSRLLGVYRDRILASQFGAGQVLDVYYSAFRIPDLIFNLLILGALSAGFIPVFAGLLNGGASHKNKEAWKLVNNVLNSVFLLLLFLSVVGFIFAPLLIKIISPGFSVEAKALTTALTRIMFLSPIFLGISGVFGGVLQSFKTFFVYSLSPIFYNIGIILGALVFYHFWGISGLAWGVVLGAFMHMAIQIPVLRSLGFRYRPMINLRDKNLRTIWRMMVPRTLSLAISQINLVVITAIASGLAVGSLAIFNLANNIQSFAIGIFGISYAVAAFPALAESANNKSKLIEHFSNTTRQILFFMIPAGVFLITLRAQIIRVVLGTGAFDWSATILTFQTLGFFALSLFAQALVALQSRVFYALKDSRTPFFIGLITVVANVLLSLYLGKKMGVAGLALAFSLANILNFILLWLALWFRIGNLDHPKILMAAIKFSVAGVVAGFGIQFIKNIIGVSIDMTRFYGILTQAGLASLFGFVLYLLFLWLLRTEELYSFVDLIKRHLPWNKVKTEDQGQVRGI